MSLFRTLLVLHILLGTAAVVIGFVALVTAKGAGAHLTAGRRFLQCMVVVLGSAWLMTLLRFNPYFAGLSASATLATFSGWRVLGRKRPDLDARQRAQPLDWAVALLSAGIAVTLVTLAHMGRIRTNVPVVLSLGYGTLVYAAWDLMRFSRPLGRPFTPRLWLYEHIAKMTGAYFGAVAAFSGSVLVFLDPPWRQLWATFLGQALVVGFIVHYVRRGRRPRRGPADAVERAMGDAAA